MPPGRTVMGSASISHRFIVFVQATPPRSSRHDDSGVPSFPSC
jgi:hypothetical protein